MTFRPCCPACQIRSLLPPPMPTHETDMTMNSLHSRDLTAKQL